VVEAPHTAGGSATSTPATPPWNFTLHLEVRSRGKRPGQSNLEQRVYTNSAPANRKHPDDATVQMVVTTESFGYIQHSVTTLKPSEVDLVARSAVFRESRVASDKFVDRLEYFGWIRRPDLEATGA
jgi:hypothetical protein